MHMEIVVAIYNAWYGNEIKIAMLGGASLSFPWQFSGRLKHLQ